MVKVGYDSMFVMDIFLLIVHICSITEATIIFSPSRYSVDEGEA